MHSSVKRLLSLISLKTIIVAGLFLISFFAFSFIIHEAVLEHEDHFDEMIYTFSINHSSPQFIEFMRYFTLLGSSYFLLPAYIFLLVYLVVKKRPMLAIDISIIAISSFLLIMGLKQLFHRDRPLLPLIKGITNYSFPSGHALSSFIFCTILAYLIWNGKLTNSWKYFFLFFLLIVAVTIGISRIVLRVHYATDVIAGFSLGVIWVILSFWVIGKLKSNYLDGSKIVF
jgi:membrane-associated phospholipid phosphatase